MPRPAASSAALLMLRPDERRSIDCEILSDVCDRWRWVAIASTLLLIRRAIGSGVLSCGQMLLGELLAGAGTSGSLAGAFAASAFSVMTASQISSRYTGMDLGAAMPMRTVEPVTSITSI